MVQTLSDHFKFWDAKIMDINQMAIQAIKDLDFKHDSCHKNYRDFLENVSKLVPNMDREINHVENVERILINLYKIQDARYVRAKSLLKKEKAEADHLIRRFTDMRRQLHHLKLQLEKEKKQLLTMVTDAIKKAMNKRRAEFKKLWVKYTKVSRSIENLQHKENCRLSYLESEYFHFSYFFFVFSIFFVFYFF